MGTTVIDLCNMALGQISGGRISALTDPTNEAQWCNLYWPQTRDEVLREHEWNCALATQALAKLTPGPAYGHLNRYQLPTDPGCILPIEAVELVTADDGTVSYNQITYEIFGDKLHTDAANVTLKYVKREEDPGKLDPLVIEAMVLLLASKLAIPIANKPALAGALMDRYRLKVTEAMMQDSLYQTESEQDPELWTDR